MDKIQNEYPIEHKTVFCGVDIENGVNLMVA